MREMAEKHREVLFDASNIVMRTIERVHQSNPAVGRAMAPIQDTLLAAMTYDYDYWLSRQPKEAK